MVKLDFRKDKINYLNAYCHFNFLFSNLAIIINKNRNKGGEASSFIKSFILLATTKFIKTKNYFLLRAA